MSKTCIDCFAQVERGQHTDRQWVSVSRCPACRKIELCARIKSKVKIDRRGCWIWQGAKSQGYGKMSIDDHVEWVHRVSYSLFIGPLLEGQYACHRCDVRDCVNPDHLFAGTQTDNMRDCFNKGRGSQPPIAMGYKHYKATLTDVQVVEIRAKGVAGISQHKIAREYNCSQSTVWRLINGLTRKDAVRLQA